MANSMTIKRSDSARFGEGIGRGLSEQLPKEYDRYRLSEGLKKLEGTSEDMSPIQQLAALKRYGASDNEIAMTLPLLERANANKQSKKQAEDEYLSNQKNTDFQSPSLSRTYERNKENDIQRRNIEDSPRINSPLKNTKKLTTKGPEQAALNPIPPLSAQEARARGVELHRNYPSKYKTVDDGEAAARAERQAEIDIQNTEVNLGNTQKQLRAQLENETAKRLGMDIQKQGIQTYEDLPGTYIKNVIDAADTEVASGNKTIQEAADDASNELKAYADLRLKNKTEGARSWFSKGSKGARSTIKSQREAYKQRGELKTFVNDLVVNHDLSKPRASYLAYPISEHKELNNWIAKQKNLGDPNISFTHTPEKAEIAGRKLANELPKYIGDNDSLLAIAAEIQGKGMSGEDFLDEVRNLLTNDKIRLNGRQIEELEESGDLGMTLGDWFLFEMGQFGSLPEVL